MILLAAEGLNNDQIAARPDSRLKGKCKVCEYRELCGGCRNRAFAYTGDIYESDPACVYIPESLRKK